MNELVWDQAGVDLGAEALDLGMIYDGLRQAIQFAPGDVGLAEFEPIFSHLQPQGVAKVERSRRANAVVIVAAPVHSDARMNSK